MSQSDGEPACQGKTYNASKDKKHLTGINKEELFDRTPPNVSQMDSWLVQKLLEHTPKTEDFYR